MKTRTYQLETLTCPGCVTKLETAIKRLKGVSEVQVLFNASKLKATFEEGMIESQEIKKIIEDLGFDVLGEK